MRNGGEISRLWAALFMQQTEEEETPENLKFQLGAFGGVYPLQ